MGLAVVRARKGVRSVRMVVSCMVGDSGDFFFWLRGE